MASPPLVHQLKLKHWSAMVGTVVQNLNARRWGKIEADMPNCNVLPALWCKRPRYQILKSVDVGISRRRCSSKRRLRFIVSENLEIHNSFFALLWTLWSRWSSSTWRFLFLLGAGTVNNFFGVCTCLNAEDTSSTAGQIENQDEQAYIFETSRTSHCELELMKIATQPALHLPSKNNFRLKLKSQHLR